MASKYDGVARIIIQNVGGDLLPGILLPAIRPVF